MTDVESSGITTLYEAYLLYIATFPAKAVQLKTALFRYLLPYPGFKFNFEIKRGKSLSPQQLETAQSLANQIQLKDLWEIDRVLTWQAEVFALLNVPIKTIRRPNKHYLKHFLQWCKDQGYLKPPSPRSWEVPQSLPADSNAYYRRSGLSKNLIANRRSILDYGATTELLSELAKQQLAEFTAFWSDQYYSGTRPIQKLSAQSTCREHCEFLLYLLGWLSLDKLDYHCRMCDYATSRKAKDNSYDSPWLLMKPEAPEWLIVLQEIYPPIELKNIDFKNIISVIEICPEMLAFEEVESASLCNTTSSLLQKIQDELKLQNASLSFETAAQIGQIIYKNEILSKEVRQLNPIHAKHLAEENRRNAMKQECRRIRTLLKDFFKWLQYQHNPNDSPDGYRISPTYREKFCNTLINLTKFFYRDITDPHKFANYTDIDVVLELRNLRHEETNVNFKPNPVSSVKRNPTWNELGSLLRELLESCSPRRKIGAEKGYEFMGAMRDQTAVARDFQKYLIMMFFRVVSPDRQHVIRELKENDTLKLCWLNWETMDYEEAPWDNENRRYLAYYNAHTKLYYLEASDVKDEKGNFIDKPKGKNFEWVVFLDASQTKVNQDNAYRIPKIYNPELESWLHGREDYSGTWFNWPLLKGGGNNKWSKQQFHWCGYVNPETGERSGFREVFQPTHDFVFTQRNNKPFTANNMCRLYEAILWKYLGIRSNPHGIRSAVVGHFIVKGMSDAESQSLAKLKSHSVETQNSSSYNKLHSLQKTARASRMIVNEFLEEQGLALEEYGLAGESIQE